MAEYICYADGCERRRGNGQVLCWHHWKMISNGKRKGLVRAFKKRFFDEKTLTNWNVEMGRAQSAIDRREANESPR